MGKEKIADRERSYRRIKRESMEKEGIVKSPVNSLAETNPLVRYMQDRIASNSLDWDYITFKEAQNMGSEEYAPYPDPNHAN